MAEPASYDLSRVVVIGTSCSGKTTFARELARRLGADWTDLDSLNWLPDWQEREPDDFRARVAAWTAGERWVIDGNYSRVHDLLWTRATAVIWLDYPFPLVMWRAIKRTTHRAVTGQEICNGNRETWQKALLSRDSILLWVITSYHRRKRTNRARFARNDHPNATKIRLKNPPEAARFLEGVRPI